MAGLVAVSPVEATLFMDALSLTLNSVQVMFLAYLSARFYQGRP